MSDSQVGEGGEEFTRTVPITRITMVSRHSFDDVLRALRQGIGRPADPAALEAQWDAARTPDELERITAEAQGSSGLIEFLTLDLGAVIALRHPNRAYRMVRVIAGNPVTMSDMAVSIPDVGSYAPITILVAEWADGVHLSYDSIVSAIAGYEGPDAHTVADRLEAAVLQLMRSAAGIGDV